MIALALCIWLPIQDPGGLLNEGINAYDAMELDLAREKLSAARKSGSADERARADLWLGVVELERGRDAAARRHLRAALQADPDLAVPSRLSPKVRALVDELRPAEREAPKEARRDVQKDASRDAPRARRAARAPPREAAARLPAMLPAPSPPATPAAPPEPMDAPVPAPSPASDAAPATPTDPAPTPSPVDDPAAPMEPGASAEPSAVTISPFLVLAAGGGALAATGLVAAVALGVSAKLLEAEAAAAPRAATATATYEQAAGSALVANAMFAGSALAAVGGAACAGVWLANGGLE